MSSARPINRMHGQPHYIYSLLNPLDGNVFYVGRTVYKDLNVRLKLHVQLNKNSNLELKAILDSIVSKGLMPKIILIEKTILFRREGELIKEYSIKYKLTNKKSLIC